MIVVDSSVWIANIRKQASSQVEKLRELTQNELIAGDIVVLEVLRGMRSEREAAVYEKQFRTYGITRLLDPEVAIAAAANYRRLRALGITIRATVDMVIATYCIENGHYLLHQDRDFDHFERHLGLRVVR
jgi:predicted nucleic acid-binding protein